MKLNKANNDGTISITIPKHITIKHGWEPGQDIDLTDINDVYFIIRNNKQLLQRDGDYPKGYENVEEILNKLKEVSNTIESTYLKLKLLGSEIEDTGCNLVFDNNELEKLMMGTIKTTLIDVLDRLGE